MLEIQNLSTRYGYILALEGVDLTIGPGELVGLFGENGAGKTTLMKSILGLLHHGGEVTLDDEPLTRRNIERLSFATSEHSFFPDLTPEEHRKFYRDHFPRWRDGRYRALMDFFELPPTRRAGFLSTGQKNELEVILALSQGADYILMDEPFSGSDVFNRGDFYKVLSGILEDTETVILSTHLIEEVENFVSRAVLIRKGKILGDELISTLEDRGEDLMGFVTRTYGYEPDRVSRAIEKLTGEEGQ